MGLLKQISQKIGASLRSDDKGHVHSADCAHGDEKSTSAAKHVHSADCGHEHTEESSAKEHVHSENCAHGPVAKAAPAAVPGGGRPAPTAAEVDGLGRVQNILAVASGKGGVGKSTVAVNLARALAAQGLRVGLFDADIYGPSLPLMTKAGRPEHMEGHLIIPPEDQGVKVLSLGMLSSPDKAQILRGPMAGNMIRQLLIQGAWGELDYLIIDYPPGTGDIQLTLSQVARITAAVIVTTPQEVALADVRKAVAMFDALKVPVLGVVENMSIFVCDGCGKEHAIFAKGGAARLSKTYGFPQLAAIPLDPEVGIRADRGESMIDQSTSPVAAAFDSAAAKMLAELTALKARSSAGLGSFALKWRDE